MRKHEIHVASTFKILREKEMKRMNDQKFKEKKKEITPVEKIRGSEVNPGVKKALQHNKSKYQTSRHV